jgi:hypothetical protein
VLHSAEVDYDLPATSSTVQLSAKANALDVVRTLGLAPALDTTYGITDEVRRSLAAKTVSIDLKVGPGGSPVTFVVDGRQVATEIDPGGTASVGGYLATVQRSYSSFTVKDFGTPADVAAPAANEVLPKNAPSGTTC